jgi:hypothetical protein
MHQTIEKILKARRYVIGRISDLSNEQLNVCPPGFNNNIIWNLGHLVAAQEGICYRRSGLPGVVGEEYFATYKPGSRPERPITDEEVGKVRELLTASVDRLQEDYDNKIFREYKQWTNRYGMEITSIDLGIDFVLFHDAYHGGVIDALKKVVTTN